MTFAPLPPPITAMASQPLSRLPGNQNLSLEDDISTLGCSSSPFLLLLSSDQTHPDGSAINDGPVSDDVHSDLEELTLQSQGSLVTPPPPPPHPGGRSLARVGSRSRIDAEAAEAAAQEATAAAAEEVADGREAKQGAQSENARQGNFSKIMDRSAFDLRRYLTSQMWASRVV